MKQSRVLYVNTIIKAIHQSVSGQLSGLERCCLFLLRLVSAWLSGPMLCSWEPALMSDTPLSVQQAPCFTETHFQTTSPGLETLCKHNLRLPSYSPQAQGQSPGQGFQNLWVAHGQVQLLTRRLNLNHVDSMICRCFVPRIYKGFTSHRHLVIAIVSSKDGRSYNIYTQVQCIHILRIKLFLSLIY